MTKVLGVLCQEPGDRRTHTHTHTLIISQVLSNYKFMTAVGESILIFTVSLLPCLDFSNRRLKTPTAVSVVQQIITTERMWSWSQTW